MTLALPKALTVRVNVGNDGIEKGLVAARLVDFGLPQGRLFCCWGSIQYRPLPGMICRTPPRGFSTSLFPLTSFKRSILEARNPVFFHALLPLEQFLKLLGSRIG